MTSLELLTDVNVPSKCNKKNTRKKLIFVVILSASDEYSRIVSGTDPRIRIRTQLSTRKESEPFLEQVPELHELLLPPAELRPLSRQLLLQASHLTVPVLGQNLLVFWIRI